MERSEVYESGNVVDGSHEPTRTRSSSPDAVERATQAQQDNQHLGQRLANARASTQALVAEYVECCARIRTEIARRREELATLERIRAELNASVTRYAHLLRALGEPPERALVVIKVAFSEAAPHQDDDNRAVLEDIVRWAVDAYYAA